jgi:hypothetical protein
MQKKPSPSNRKPENPTKDARAYRKFHIAMSGLLVVRAELTVFASETAHKGGAEILKGRDP